MVVRITFAGIVIASIALAGCIDPDGSDPVSGEGPVAVIETQQEHYTVGTEVVLNGTASRSPDGGGLDYRWTIGEDTSAGAVVHHVFDEVGNHTVALTVTDAQGADDTATVNLTIAETEYVQHVWFNWDTLQLDVLILHVEDPAVGAAIQEAIAAWENGIAELAPDLSENLTLRVYWPGTGGVPPTDFDPDIFFVPVGFMAASDTPGDGTCTAFAPAGYIGPDPTDQEEFYFTAAHEFGHCLGLTHVFHNDVEYEPAFDLLGGGSVHDSWGKSCPSNLNIEILRMVFNGQEGTLVMPSSQYHQAQDC